MGERSGGDVDLPSQTLLGLVRSLVDALGLLYPSAYPFVPSCLSADGRTDIVECVYQHAYNKLKDIFTLHPFADLDKELTPEERKKLASDKASKSGQYTCEWVAFHSSWCERGRGKV